jgi:ParB family chromosome partitioning protein
MATTTAPEPKAVGAAAEASTAQLRHVPLSRIVVPEGFNPRGEVADDAELDQLAETIRRHGCLQPIRVRETDGGELELIAGERRYRAALKAGLTEIPAIVRSSPSGDDDERADLLVEALIENDQRRELDPLEPSGIGSDATFGVSGGCDGAWVRCDVVSSAWCECAG